jgi:hypothetical protein
LVLIPQIYNQLQPRVLSGKKLRYVKIFC